MSKNRILGTVEIVGNDNGIAWLVLTTNNRREQHQAGKKFDNPQILATFERMLSMMEEHIQDSSIDMIHARYNTVNIINEEGFDWV